MSKEEIKDLVITDEASGGFSEDEIQMKDNNESVEKTIDLFFSECRRGTIAGIRTLLHQSIPQLANSCNKNGQSGISLACSTNNISTLKELLSISTTDVNTADNDGNTPLMMAAQAGYDDVVRFLLFFLRPELDVDAEDNKGFTALMKAALRGKSNCARMLIVAGADVTKRDWGRGLRADEWALRCGMKQTATIIKNVAQCNLKEEQRKEMDWVKKERNSVIEFCSWIGKCLKRTLRWDNDRWTVEAGALYHLASHSASLHSGLVAVSLPKRNERSKNKERAGSIETSMTCINEQDNVIQSDDVLQVEMTYSNCPSHHTKHTVTQKCYNNKALELHEPMKSPKLSPEATPKLEVIASSPTKQKKTKRQKVNYNYLVVPKKPKKQKCP